MKVTRTDRGFELIEHEHYPLHDKEGNPHEPVRLVQASSAIGNYPDSFDRAGSSFLWIGPDIHLNREEVADLVRHLTAWVETGSLEVTD